MNLDSLIHGFVEERVNEAKAKMASFKIFCSVFESTFSSHAELAAQIYTLCMYQMLINPEWQESDLIEWVIKNLEQSQKIINK